MELTDLNLYAGWSFLKMLCCTLILCVTDVKLWSCLVTALRNVIVEMAFSLQPA